MAENDPPKGMKMAEVRVMTGDREKNLKLLHRVFTPEILALIESEDPGRIDHYCQMIDMIVTILHAMTSPDDSRGMHFQPGSLPLEDEEVELLLTALEEAGIVTNGEHGYRISEAGLRCVKPFPVETVH